MGNIVRKIKLNLNYLLTECRRQNLNSFSIYLDSLWSSFRYGASPRDYLDFEFYRKSSSERKKFVTHTKFERLIKKLNTYSGGTKTAQERADLMNDKILFNTHFQKFIGREWLDMRSTDLAAFTEFFKKHGAVFCKINRESCGRGAFKAVYEPDQVEAVYQRLTAPQKQNQAYIAEQVLSQASEVAEVAPSSINTFRIYTILYHNQFYVLAALWRMGGGKLPVDNFASGGVVAEIDIETGILSTLARDKERVSYLFHPFSHVLVPGRQIPRWKEILNLVESAHRTVPEIGYAGWDAALTADGTPVLVEANFRGDRNILQLVSQTGRWPLIQKICGIR